MKARAVGADIIIEDCSEFDIAHTFECGQCFRFNRCKDKTYEGVHGKHALKIGQIGDKVMLYNTSIEEYEKVWKKYFDISRDYASLQRELSRDDAVLESAINEGRGIRILLQDAFETIISFIISANNNIPRIKLIIERLCETYGEKIEAYGRIFYTFPSAKTLSRLTTEDLAPIKAGFRDKYILDAAKKVHSGEIDIEKIYGMEYEDAKNELKKIKGVGEKVANCILLFGFGKQNAFPVDVWVKRILEYYYKDKYDISDANEFAKRHFGSLGGFAQQYLFYYARQNKIAK